MHKPSWRLDKIIKNIKKKKFKAMLRYFYDSQYRDQVNYMVNLVKQNEVKCIETTVRIGDIKFGHSINYPKWVQILRYLIHRDGYLSLDPIKVIIDNSCGKYLVVDGNHRLMALKQELISSHKIPVKLLLPINVSRGTRESV